MAEAEHVVAAARPPGGLDHELAPQARRAPAPRPRRRARPAAPPRTPSRSPTAASAQARSAPAEVVDPRREDRLDRRRHLDRVGVAARRPGAVGEPQAARRRRACAAPARRTAGCRRRARPAGRGGPGGSASPTSCSTTASGVARPTAAAARSWSGTRAPTPDAARAARSAPCRRRAPARVTLLATSTSRSSSTGSAQCRSSKTTITGPRSATTSSRRRTAHADCSDGSRAGVEPDRAALRCDASCLGILRARRPRGRAFARRSPWESSSPISGGAADHLRQRPVGDPLAVGEAAPGQHGGALAVALDQLGDQPRLADPGVAEHGDELARVRGPRRARRRP